jgi:hypothetical protein
LKDQKIKRSQVNRDTKSNEARGTLMKALASKLEDDTESLYKVKKLKGIGSLKRLDGNSSVDNRSSNLPSIHRNGVTGNTDAGSPKSDL